MKYIRILFLLLLTFVIIACSDESNSQSGDANGDIPENEVDNENEENMHEPVTLSIVVH